MEQHFLTLAEIAPGLCRTKKTLENLVGPDGQIRLGQRRLQTIKIGATRVVPRVSYEQLIRDLLLEAGVSAEAAARLASRTAAPNEEVTSQPSPSRRAGRPRLSQKTGGAA
jgi:hypothetical protein